ncbi:RNA-binding protein [uncultured Limosilactobacillus sp.]|uniref:YlmH family RNA-binding protein n=1 Tax=uncultured Limosilactobacillus sp. TaxID=2837629 RepID=UPI0025D912B9|nr:RNA-binding protein [uncultured Limosilactobacillus sp.]
MVGLNVSQHFRSDEHDFLNQVMDMISTVTGEYRPVLSNFLNPRQLFIAETLVNRETGLCYQSWGGYPNAEMQRLLIYPDYYQPSDKDFNICLLEIKYPTKFVELHHRQILGTLMGNGLTRASFGDILNDGLNWQIIISEDVSHFVTRQLDRIGRINVKFVEIDGQSVITPQDDWEDAYVTVPSFRLDAVIANVFNYSRNRAKETIEHDLVTVNWEKIERPDYQLAVHDLVSVRHSGRIRLVQTGGTNRKNNHRLEIQLIKA